MNDLFDRTDEELVALYAEGNNGAFDVLLKRHQVRTFNYIYYIVKDKELANDIFQETFVSKDAIPKTVSSLHGFPESPIISLSIFSDRKKPIIMLSPIMKTWISLIAKN